MACVNAIGMHDSTGGQRIPLFHLPQNLCTIYYTTKNCSNLPQYRYFYLEYTFLTFFQMSVIVDTGSTTLAVASYPRIDNDIYFHANNSNSIYDSQNEV